MYPQVVGWSWMEGSWTQVTQETLCVKALREEGLGARGKKQKCQITAVGA